VGFISSMSHPFCGDCTRARVSAEGKMYLCLFARDGVDLKPLLQAGGDEALADAVRSSWQRRGDRYSELRGTQPINVSTGPAALGGARQHRIVRMSLVGG
jgi:cyclic pyranopterin phosphate synthase